MLVADSHETDPSLGKNNNLEIYNKMRKTLKNGPINTLKEEHVQHKKEYSIHKSQHFTDFGFYQEGLYINANPLHHILCVAMSSQIFTFHTQKHRL